MSPDPRVTPAQSWSTVVGLRTGLSVLDDPGTRLLSLSLVLGGALAAAVLNTGLGALGGYLYDQFVADN